MAPTTVKPFIGTDMKRANWLVATLYKANYLIRMLLEMKVSSVVFDESSLIQGPRALVSLAALRGLQFIAVVGDDKQIAPVVKTETLRSKPWAESLFAMTQAALIVLRRIWRCPRGVTNTISDMFYSQQLESMWKEDEAVTRHVEERLGCRAPDGFIVVT